jgi:hypothetical protein
LKRGGRGKLTAQRFLRELGLAECIEDGEQVGGAGAVCRMGGTVGVEQSAAVIQEEISAELQDVFAGSGQSRPVASQQAPEITQDYRRPEENPGAGAFQSQGLIEAALRVCQYADLPPLGRPIAG